MKKHTFSVKMKVSGDFDNWKQGLIEQRNN